MFKKPFIGLAPLLAVAAFAVMPVAAQAETQHWYRNGVKLAEGTPVPIVMFGGKVNLAQNSARGEVNCRTVAGGTIENPTGGGAGVGSMNAAAFYQCKAPQCEKEIMELTALEGRGWVEADNMPASINGHTEKRFVSFAGWSMLLEESTVEGVSYVRLKIGEPFVKFESRSPAGMIRVRDECEIAPSESIGGSGPIFEGELKPEIGVAKSGNLNGTKATVPSTMKFSGASTGALHAEVFGEGTYTNSLKYLGYNEQEVITVKP